LRVAFNQHRVNKGISSHEWRGWPGGGGGGDKGGGCPRLKSLRGGKNILNEKGIDFWSTTDIKLLSQIKKIN